MDAADSAFNEMRDSDPVDAENDVEVEVGYHRR
jgi:hypothetical protein